MQQQQIQEVNDTRAEDYFDEVGHGTMVAFMLEKLVGNQAVTEAAARKLWESLPNQAQQFMVQRYFSYLEVMMPNFRTIQH